jgi:hypothetical protein
VLRELDVEKPLLHTSQIWGFSPAQQNVNEHIWSWVGVVSVVTGLLADRFGVQFLTARDVSLSHKCPDWFRGPPSSSVGSGEFFPLD